MKPVRYNISSYADSRPFQVAVNYSPRGDQRTAVEELGRGPNDGEKHQVLLGVTGSGKTFTMAKLIEKTARARLYS